MELARTTRESNHLLAHVFAFLLNMGNTCKDVVPQTLTNPHSLYFSYGLIQSMKFSVHRDYPADCLNLHVSCSI